LREPTPARQILLRSFDLSRAMPSTGYRVGKAIRKSLWLRGSETLGGRFIRKKRARSPLS
jgi:hypothetical protein